MAMTGAERQKAYKERRRAEAEAGLPPEAPRKRYELAYGADGRVIAWRALGSPQWVLGSGRTWQARLREQQLRARR